MIEPDKFVRWQIDHLQSEIAVAAAPGAGHANPLAERIYRSAWFRFVTQHLQNFYWTVTRFVGLGYLHDATLRKPEEAERHEVVQPPVSFRAGAQYSRLYNGRGDFCSNVTFSAHYGTTGIADVIREYAKWAVETRLRRSHDRVEIPRSGAGLSATDAPGRELTIETGDILFSLRLDGERTGHFHSLDGSRCPKRRPCRPWAA